MCVCGGGDLFKFNASGSVDELLIHGRSVFLRCYEDDVDHSAEMHLDKVLEPSEVGGGGGGGGGSGQEAPQGGTFHEPMVTS